MRKHALADQPVAVAVLAEELHRVAILLRGNVVGKWSELSPLKRQEWHRWAHKVATRMDEVTR